jgi:Zn-finger nucleic acid-binding protein
MVNCPYCNRNMSCTGRIDNPGVEFRCNNCGGVWLYVENPEPEIINMKHGILIENSVFFPVYYPKVLEDILEQQHDKKQKK